MSLKNKNLDSLTGDLVQIISDKKAELIKLNKKITLDTDYWVKADFKAILSYLKNYKKNQIPKGINNLKPKGKILMILSFNEPFLLSVVPVLNALVAGNEVTLKPSKKNMEFVKLIWEKSGLIKKYNLKLKIKFVEKEKIGEIIKGNYAVYFFGSLKVARSIAKICGENFIEFYPEVETAESKIYNKNKLAIKDDVIQTLKESFIHSGQICQRIQGIFVQKKFYNDYIKILKEKFIEMNKKNKLIEDNFIFEREKIYNEFLLDLKNSKPKEIVQTESLPILVIDPSKKSDFINNAYFLPILWVSSFESLEDLVEILNSRKFFLGLNIQSDDANFIDNIVANTKFTRYTINSSHTNIRSTEGWGGAWPSGFSGYKNWIEHFSDRYTIIR